ncbi:MAG: 1-acyl-sn-glycerol-3-phosphate acyltransferase [Chloroflexi bacterium]|nr:1-acyl-sn-glycerol-3-phosphate acyltransferase [Chloroflexota bacterium]MCI0818937.1 1-acyl-sn-glycerol-3-phosphate acyltransferase [Chloroflexota bacterium]MCI0838408.1 1-acyl-sn-glycerol-3-phosphate acyltransferase [Chloroflexota bacterium]MCI0842126.1 1-acyl-sn-glycerol-3-phosphate acyltransferase [Chloroflexota bacterium]MCI0882885.1 1-acyl-sn-glycerol-3-phosphate acyltransferase [Chloroflexota bacterium]
MRRLALRLFYFFNLSWTRALLMLISSRDIRGRENVPPKGALIVASNHLSNGDPPVLTVAVPRQIAWMTKAEWFNTPVIGPLLRLGGMIPVRRFEADLQALRRAQHVLRDGGVLAMFPEGTRGGDKGLRAGEPGTALIALRTSTPIVPIAIWGTEHVKLPRDLLRRTRVDVRFGKPFTLQSSGRITRDDVARGTETIMREIAALLPERYRGVYRDMPTEVAAAKE